MRLVIFGDESRRSNFNKAFSSKRVLYVPAIHTQRLKWRRPSGSFDYVLVTSPKALKNLSEAPPHRCSVFIGKKTAQGFRQSSRQKRVVLRESHREGILHFFKSKPPSRIFFPRSQQGDPRTVQVLRRQGHQVLVRHTYRTQPVDKRSLRKALAPIEKNSGCCFLFLSPSSFRSFKRLGLSLADRTWQPSGYFAIGPTTAKVMRDAGLSVLTPRKATIEALVRFAFRFDKKRSKL